MTRTTLRDLAPWAVIAFGMGLGTLVLKSDLAGNILTAGITAAATFLPPRGRGGETVTAMAGDPPTVTTEPAE